MSIQRRITVARNRRTALAIGATLIATAALAGCTTDTGGGGAATGAPVDPEGASMGFSAAVLDNPFTVQLVKTVETGGADAGFKMVPTTNADGDTAKQITDMNTLITQGVKGIFLIPRDSDAIVPGVEAANAAGIPVITVDTAANGGDIYMNIRADNVAMGTSVCEELGALIPENGTVLEIQGGLDTSSGADRTQGFNDCMKENFPGVTIISRPTDWVTANAADVAQTVLSTTPIDGVFLASDSVMLEAVSTVMKDLSMYVPEGESGHIPLITIDGSGPSLEAIRGGFVDAVISQPINDYAKFGVAYMKDALEGKTYETGPTDHDSEIVEYEGNLADMLPSPVVTEDNVDDDSLWGNAK